MYCKSLVIHEFGHALGLIHEHQREDRPFNINVKYVKHNFEKLGMPSYKATKENIINTYPNIHVDKSKFEDALNNKEELFEFQKKNCDDIRQHFLEVNEKNKQKFLNTIKYII